MNFLIDTPKRVCIHNWLWSHGYVEGVAYGIALAITNERAAGRLYNIAELQTRTMVDFIRAIRVE
ncbi:hypothetical protein [Lysinibacillus sp. NPDC059133]|uniref:hypothetical protein n=1 Tax=Lysinibacillus sp. NPDC059133 TaxID=3346737 RepID=UPI0036D1BC07